MEILSKSSDSTCCGGNWVRVESILILNLSKPLGIIFSDFHQHASESREEFSLSLRGFTNRSRHLRRKTEDDLDGRGSSSIFEGLLRDNLCDYSDQLGSLCLPALRVSSCKLIKRFKGLSTLILIFIESLNDDVEEMREDWGESKCNGRVIDTANEGRYSLQGGNSHKNLTILEGTVKDLLELIFGSRELLTGQVHLTENLENIHGELALLG